jgi:DNA-binding CsgD family transcriptional regulator
MDRARREAELHARETTLQERNEALTRLDRINTTIRNIDKALVSASSRSEIETVVCEELTEAGPYTFAWIGKHESLTDELTPRVGAGVEDTYLEEVVDGDPQTLADLARIERAPQVENDLFTGARSETWRQEALTRGYHAAIALPLVYEDTTFGILTVFADQPGVFDDLEEAVLDELSDNVAHAINAVENKRSLVSDEVTELTFEVPFDSFDGGGMIAATGGSFHHDGLVADADGDLRWFFTARDVDPDEVQAFESSPWIDAMERLDGRADGDAYRFEARMAYEGLPAAVLEHGGTLHDVEAADGTATVAVDLHTGTDVREFVEMFRTKYPGARLCAKHDRERPLQTKREFRSVLTETLTPRQREVLRTAYFSGYFEEPRTRTGGEIATSLDISQPTFTTHLRTAERKIYGELLADPE